MCEAYDGLEKADKSSVLSYICDEMNKTKHLDKRGSVVIVTNNRVRRHYDHNYSQHKYEGNFKDIREDVRAQAEEFFSKKETVSKQNLKAFMDKMKSKLDKSDKIVPP